MMSVRPTKPVKWPNGCRLGLLLTFDFQAEEGVPLLPGGHKNYQEITDRRYGATRGVYRVLSILAAHGVPATFRVCGRTAEKYPEAVKAVKEAGHEVGGHGWAHELLDGLSPEEEGDVIEKTVRAIGEVTGERILGWRSPQARPSSRTVDLLTEAGFEWRSDLLNSDLPYRLEGGKKPLVEIPHTWTTSDMTLYNPSQIPAGIPRRVFDTRREEFDMLYAEAGTSARMMTLTLHPFASGRPARARVLGEFIRYAKGFPGVWFARCIDVARWWVEMGY